MKHFKTIYLVDDDEDDRMFTREALESVIKGARIVELTDGAALTLLAESGGIEEPALILMDLNMPRQNGLETLAYLRQKPGCQHIPVMMISTTSHQPTICRAYELGVNAFVIKPVLLADYIKLAQAVNICFLNNYLSFNQPTTSQDFKGKSLLIIEDNADHAGLMKFVLKQSMPEVVLFHAESAESALEFLAGRSGTGTAPVELIILDLYLPARHQGLDLLDAIRNYFISRQMPHVPIVVLSASDHQQDIKASYQHRANAYMVKSQDPARPFSYLKEVCQFWWETSALP